MGCADTSMLLSAQCSKTEDVQRTICLDWIPLLYQTVLPQVDSQERPHRHIKGFFKAQLQNRVSKMGVFPVNKTVIYQRTRQTHKNL